MDFKFWNGAKIEKLRSEFAKFAKLFALVEQLIISVFCYESFAILIFVAKCKN